MGDSGYGEAGDHPAARGGRSEAVYALGRSSGESDRLYRQADELRPESEALVERAGLGAGDRAIDVGCGPRGILDLLAERVSPSGLVVGLDADAALVAMAEEFAASRGLDHVELVLADARDTGIESGSFDLVHARTLLINLPEPLEALTEMVRLARPGGWVVGIEPDVQSALRYPPLPAFDRLCELFQAAFSRSGAASHMSAAAWPTSTVAPASKTSPWRLGRPLPARSLPPHAPGRPRAKPPPPHPRDGTRRRRRTRRTRRRGTNALRRPRHRRDARPHVPRLGPQTHHSLNAPARVAHEHTSTRLRATTPPPCSAVVALRTTAWARSAR